MLILTRRIGETVNIGNDVTVTVAGRVLQYCPRRIAASVFDRAPPAGLCHGTRHIRGSDYPL